MKLKLLAFFIASMLLLCSCSAEQTASSEFQSSNSTTTVVETKRYTDDFRYASIDEFISKVEQNGIEEFCKCEEYRDTVPEYRATERHEEITNMLNNCVWEVYYKGQKAELQETVGFNVSIYDRVYRGSDTSCEYFFKYSDPDYGECVSFVNFSYSPLKYWDSSVKYAKNDAGKLFVEIPFNGKLMECIIYGEYDFETGIWVTNNREIVVNYNDEIVITFDFIPIEEIEYYARRIELDGYVNSYGVEKKLKEELMIEYLPFGEDHFLENFFEYFSFKKVDNISLP